MYNQICNIQEYLNKVCIIWKKKKKNKRIVREVKCVRHWGLMTPDKRKRGTMYDRGDWSTRRNRTSERGNGATNLAGLPAVRFQPNESSHLPTIPPRSVLLPRHSLRPDKTFRHRRKRSRGSVFLRCFNHRCLESKRSYLWRNVTRFRMLGPLHFLFSSPLSALTYRNRSFFVASILSVTER